MAALKWAIENRAVDIVQPDLHYYGGLIRSIRVSRMAELLKIPTTVHISGGFRDLSTSICCISHPELKISGIGRNISEISKATPTGLTRRCELKMERLQYLRRRFWCQCTVDTDRILEGSER